MRREPALRLCAALGWALAAVAAAPMVPRRRHERTLAPRHESSLSLIDRASDQSDAPPWPNAGYQPPTATTWADDIYSESMRKAFANESYYRELQRTTSRVQYQYQGVEYLMHGYDSSPVEEEQSEESEQSGAPLFLLFRANSFPIGKSALDLCRRMRQHGYTAYVADWMQNTHDQGGVEQAYSLTRGNTSALSVLCRRPGTDCSKGVAIMGISHGAVVALMASQMQIKITAVLAISPLLNVDLWYLNAIEQGRYRKSLPCMLDTHVSKFMPRSQRRIIGALEDNLSGVDSPNWRNHNSTCSVTCHDTKIGCTGCESTDEDRRANIATMQAMAGLREGCEPDATRCLEADGSGYELLTTDFFPRGYKPPMDWHHWWTYGYLSTFSNPDSPWWAQTKGYKGSLNENLEWLARAARRGVRIREADRERRQKSGEALPQLLSGFGSCSCYSFPMNMSLWQQRCCADGMCADRFSYDANVSSYPTTWLKDNITAHRLEGIRSTPLAMENWAAAGYDPSQVHFLPQDTSDWNPWADQLLTESTQSIA